MPLDSKFAHSLGDGLLFRNNISSAELMNLVLEMKTTQTDLFVAKFFPNQ